MFSLTQLSGFYAKQSKKNKVFKIYYFYFDHYGCLYSLTNMAQLNYYIKNSANEADIIQKLDDSTSVKKMSLHNCRISGIKNFMSYENAPFYHRLCFEIQIPINNSIKQIYVFSIVEEDIEKLQETMKNGWQKQKPPILQNQQYQEYERKSQFIDKMRSLMNNYQNQLQQQNSDDVNQNDKLTYIGELNNDRANGSGTVFFNLEGIHYKGEFKDGVKHGSGYIADSNLDQIDCEFIDDILAGI